MLLNVLAHRMPFPTTVGHCNKSIDKVGKKWYVTSKSCYTAMGTEKLF